MNFFRFWRVVLTALLFRSQNFSKSELGFWVTPFDCDINFHLNNSVYIKIMDFGRWDWLIRSGLIKSLFQQRVSIAAVKLEIEFKKAMPPGTYFSLETKAVQKGNRSLTFQQVFRCGKEIVSSAYIKVVFVQKNKAIDNQRFLQLLPENISKTI